MTYEILVTAVKCCVIIIDAALITQIVLVVLRFSREHSSKLGLLLWTVAGILGFLLLFTYNTIQEVFTPDNFRVYAGIINLLFLIIGMSKAQKLRELWLLMKYEASKYYDIYHSSPDMIVIADKGMYKEVNETFTRVMGWTAEEAVGMGWMELVHPDDRNQGTENIRILEQGDITNSVLRMRTKSGHYLKVSWSARQWKNNLTYGSGRVVV